MYRSLKRGSARVTWQDSPQPDDRDDVRRRTLPRQYGGSGRTPLDGGLRHSESMPRTGARPGLQRQQALDMLDTGWPDSLGLDFDDDLRQAGVPAARSSSRRSSYYRGEIACLELY